MIRAASLLLVLGLFTTAAAAPLPQDTVAKESEQVLKLRREQVKWAEQGLEQDLARLEAGKQLDVTEWPGRLLRARLAVAATPEERVAICAKHLVFWKKLENMSKDKLDAGRRAIGDHLAVIIDRIEAEILLLETEARPKRAEVVAKLSKEEVDLAQKGLTQSIQRRDIPGVCSISDEGEWQKRLHAARLRAAMNRRERVAASRKYLVYMIEAEADGKSKFEAGRGTIAEVNAAICERFEADILLAQNEAKPKRAETIRRFRQEQVELARIGLEIALVRQHYVEPSPFLTESLLAWYNRVLTARLGAATSREQRVAACQAHLVSMREAEKITRERSTFGRISIGDRAIARYYLLEAEIQLLKEQAKER